MDARRPRSRRALAAPDPAGRVCRADDSGGRLRSGRWRRHRRCGPRRCQRRGCPWRGQAGLYLLWLSRSRSTPGRLGCRRRRDSRQTAVWGILAFYVIPRERRTLETLLQAQEALEDRYSRTGSYPPRTNDGTMPTTLLGDSNRQGVDMILDGFGRLHYHLDGAWKLASYTVFSFGFDGRPSDDDLCVTGGTRAGVWLHHAAASVRALLGKTSAKSPMSSISAPKSRRSGLAVCRETGGEHHARLTSPAFQGNPPAARRARWPCRDQPRASLEVLARALAGTP